MKAFEAFTKPFEAPQRSVKIKIFKLIFSFCPGFGREGLNMKKRNNLIVRKYEDT